MNIGKVTTVRGQIYGGFSSLLHSDCSVATVTAGGTVE